MSDYNCNGFSVRSQKYAVIEKEAIQCHSHISLVKFASTNNVGGTKSCHCKTCSHVKECRKYLHPTIRITTKCTQACSHCCFSCKPENTRHMTRATAQNIAQFLKNNHIISLNVMGGEFFCNTNWYDILSEWFKVNCHIRLVSNGDWGV